MKKTKINLLTSRQDYVKIARYFVWVRWITFFSTLGLLGIVGFLFLLQFVQNQQTQKLLSQQESHRAAIASRSAEEGKLVYIAKKMDFINIALKDDAHFTPYYNLLINTLASSTGSATLSAFELDKSREVTFTLLFADFADMIASFTFVESPSFLDNFEALSLSNFKSTGEEIKEYNLSFEGKFKNLE